MPAKKPSPDEHIEYHKDGTIWAKGPMLHGQPDGYWEWFRKTGTKLRSGHFAHGQPVGEWTTYDQKGHVYKVTTVRPKAAATKSAKRIKPSVPKR
jgi:antitoxin component YwqK of YwqJK toxin-antitoxin module